jgi:hypothetical protein
VEGVLLFSFVGPGVKKEDYFNATELEQALDSLLAFATAFVKGMANEH